MTTCGGIVCSNTWFLIRDAINIWTADQIASGKTPQQMADYLKTFDEWDRYDYDGNGNFDEPDGYIDHFQIVHAGGDQAAGDPIYGTDAIWSHRWYAFFNLIGGAGPSFNKLGGLEFGGGGASPVQGGGSAPTLPAGQNTGVWVGDYTIQPENGGLGVFAHEYGHDLGLPDLYDTSGNTGGAENSTGFWTLMSSGANIGDGGPDRHRRCPDRLRRLGEVPARLAELRGCLRREEVASTSSVLPSTTRSRRRASSSCCPTRASPSTLGTAP